MKSHRMNRTRKYFRPGVESLEGRCLLSGAGPLPAVASPAAPVDVLTYHNDNSRTGANLNETTLTPQNVNASSFGKLFSYKVDGDVYAQPLEVSQVRMGDGQVHNVLIVATENDSVYALDADSSAPIWHTSLLAAGETPSDNRSCTQVTPQIGVTSTPDAGCVNVSGRTPGKKVSDRVRVIGCGS